MKGVFGMKVRKFLVSILLAIFFILNSGCGIENNKVKNVIYMIGDGMGQNQVQLTQWYHVGAYDKLNMQKMPVIGLVSTYSSSRWCYRFCCSGYCTCNGF